MHPAYVAIASFEYERDDIVMRHVDTDSAHSTRISLATEDGSAYRLCEVFYTMLDDGTAVVRSVTSTPTAQADKPELVNKLVDSVQADI